MLSMVDSTWVRGERREGWREDVSFTSRRVISTSLRYRRGGKREQWLHILRRAEEKRTRV